MKLDLENKRVLLTGVTSGIGEAIALGLLEEGCHIIGIDKKSSSLSLVRNEVIDFEAENGLDQISYLLHDMPSEFDILINAAGVSIGHSLYDDKIFRTSIRVNLEVPFLISSILIQQNIKVGKKLSIINITSLGASLGFPNNPSYQITKAALGQLSRSISTDYASYGIRANNLVPGYINSGMTQSSWDDIELRNQRAARTSAGRWGQPNELVGAVKFLSSDMSSYVTGTDLVVDGGWSSKGL